MSPAFLQLMQRVFIAEGAKMEIDGATFKLRIKRSHPNYEQLVGLFHEFQTRANTDGLEIQHLYKPGGSDRVLELLREILGPEQHDRLVADIEREQRRVAGDAMAEGAVAVVKNPQLRNALMQRALEDKVIPATQVPTRAVNQMDALARGDA